MRILPRVTSQGEWITDKIRFSYDAFKRQRLLRPLFNKQGIFVITGWEKVFETLRKVVEKNPVLLLAASQTTSLEVAFLAKRWANKWFSIYSLCSDLRLAQGVAYSSMLTKFDLEDKDAICLLSFNPRLECPLFNIELKKAVSFRDLNVLVWGVSYELSYKTINLGTNVITLVKSVLGRSKLVKYFMRTRGHFLMGHKALGDRSLLLLVSRLVSCLNSYNVRWTSSLIPLWISSSGLIQVGWTATVLDEFNCANSSRLVFSMTDELALQKADNDIFVYAGSVGDTFINQADVVLPFSSPFENEGSYFTYSKILRETKPAVSGRLDVRADWSFFSAFDVYLMKSLTGSFKNKVFRAVTSLSQIRREMGGLDFQINLFFNDFVLSFDKARYLLEPKGSLVTNYFATHTLTRHSAVLALAFNRFKKNLNFK